MSSNCTRIQNSLSFFILRFLSLFVQQSYSRICITKTKSIFSVLLANLLQFIDLYYTFHVAAICLALLLIQMELVEFNLTRSLRIESVFINARRISGKSQIWRCAFQNNFDGFLFIWNRVCCLRIWTTCEQCFWRNQQKILPIIINFAQQPVNIEFFGNISCNRLVFKSVSRIYWNSLLKIVLILFRTNFLCIL